ncbi:head maturation protease [Paraconexibacter sp. AEG42_29]|uniref:Head maturation protease n=1 Tax=Paraconexibacter sp. AEG42_29 TaxID=2997339 RepID=A0AAU7ASA4_9ACTN
MSSDRLASLPLPPALKRRLPAPGQKVAVVRLQGVITPTASPLTRGVVNLASVDDALKTAFETDGLKAVALLINSPGGSPTQSALVGDRIRGLAAKHDVPVIAFCEDLAASGGYWLACAADEIIAHETSLVGSIGVVSGGFGLDGLIDRLGVERRLHTAGESKARLDPFLPEKAEDVAWLRGMQDELHAMFVAWVKARRADRLAADADLFTGEVWTGARALTLGLVDGLGTLQGVLAERYPDAEIVGLDARKTLLAKLGVGVQADGGGGLGGLLRGPDAAASALEAIDRRAAWARYGL